MLYVDTPGFLWPLPGTPGAPGVPGIPPGALLSGRRYSLESFQSNTTNPTGDTGFITINPGGYAVALQSPDPADGESLSFMRATLTANPAGAPSGFQRQGLLAIPPDGFVAGDPRMLAVRFRMAPGTTIPTAINDYLASPGGFADQAAGVLEATNGPYIQFDRTIGVASWVLRAARAGVRIQKTYSLAFDNLIHVLGLVHEGGRIRIFKDGAWVAGDLQGPEIEPATNVFAQVHHLAQLAATLAINPQIDTDWIMWGPSA